MVLNDSTMLLPNVDYRLVKWPLMETSTNVTLIVLSYLLFVKLLGPAYMKNRKPYALRMPMIVYNFGIMLYNAWIFYKLGKHGWLGKYNWLCEPLNYNVDEDAMWIVTLAWHFFISKIVELLDTVFFILRKKDSQVTFLHVFHHSLVPLAVRFAIRRGAAGYNTMFGFANSFIHVWMYMYYGLAAFGPSMQKYLWWKKYITTLQMLQFCIVTVSMLTHVFNPSCEVDPILIFISLSHCVVFLVLFAAFYKGAYRKKPIVNGGRSPSANTMLIAEIDNGSGLKHRPLSDKQVETENVSET